MFGEQFEFIVAQSIFSHAGSDMTSRALKSFSKSLAPGGLILANWLVGPEDEALSPDGSGWIYPGVLPFAEERILALAADAGLTIRRCPWWHPGRLKWFVLAADVNDLPDEAFLQQLAVAPRQA